MAWASVLSLNNIKIHKTKAVKNIYIQERYIIRLIFNLGLGTTRLRTTRPSLQPLSTIQSKTSTWSAILLKRQVTSMSFKLKSAI